MANKFVLTGNGIEIDYTIGANPSFPALTYKNGGNTKSFTPAEITTDQTYLGTLVSVPIFQTIDTGGTHFGFFLPQVQLTLGQSAPVTTIGVTESFGGPDSFPRRATTWQCVHLTGTAQEVIVPLLEPVHR
jgi:hypothetical protein